MTATITGRRHDGGEGRALTSEQLGKRLHQILELLADAPREWTTIPDDQGDIIGNDEFVGVGLIEDAKALLSEWDEEDRATDPTAPQDARQAQAGKP